VNELYNGITSVTLHNHNTKFDMMATYVFFPSGSKTRENVVMFAAPNYNIHNYSFEKEIVKLKKS